MGVPVEKGRGMFLLEVPQAESNGGKRTAICRGVCLRGCAGGKDRVVASPGIATRGRPAAAKTVACRGVGSCGCAGGEDSGMTPPGRAGRSLESRGLMWVCGVLYRERGAMAWLLIKMQQERDSR